MESFFGGHRAARVRIGQARVYGGMKRRQLGLALLDESHALPQNLAFGAVTAFLDEIIHGGFQLGSQIDAKRHFHNLQKL